MSRRYKSPTSKILVVDTNIVRSAGTTQNPMSRRCRETLQNILEICHKVILTEDIKEEWDNHQSLFSKTWRASMFARKKVVYKRDTQDNELRDKIKHLNLSEDEKTEFLKDTMLLEAALLTDGIIISQDEAVHTLMKRASQSLSEIKEIG